jgi:hypothetical protein
MGGRGAALWSLPNSAIILEWARSMHGLVREPGAHVLLGGHDQRVSDA